MAKAVRRAQHDMIAYVRFRQRDGVARRARISSRGTSPEHDVLAWGAEHFAPRMGRSTWLIATPDGAAMFDGERLQLERRRALASRTCGRYARRRRSALDDLLPQHVQPGAPERIGARTAYAGALLERAAGRRADSATRQRCARRRATRRAGAAASARWAARRCRSRRGRAARTRCTHVARYLPPLRSVAQRDASGARRGSVRCAHHAARRTARRSGGSEGRAVRRPGGATASTTRCSVPACRASRSI